MKSTWVDSTNLTQYPRLEENIKSDVVIIGGGIAGLLTAYILQNSGISCVVLEADRICNGITKNTTAKITMQHNLIYSKLIDEFGKEMAQKYFRANNLAIEKYKELCQNIECDFKILPSCVYSLNKPRAIEREARAISELGGSPQIINKIEVPLRIASAVKVENQAQFNPLKFLKNISENLTIYENTKVTNIKDNVVQTENATVMANKIIVTTHFPFINRRGFYYIKMYQERSYVLGLENAQNLNAMYIDDTGKGLTFREDNDLLLIGGYSKRTGDTEGCMEKLRSISKKLYPSSSIKYAWATQDCMTPDGIPYIGHYSGSTDDLLVATGFNKWGMTSSMISAMILSGIVNNKDDEFREVFSPNRPFLNQKQTYMNVAETFKNMIRPTTKRCSHLGCALKYNKQEHTWDCPCHGSRFEKSGDIIDNPAKKGITH